MTTATLERPGRTRGLIVLGGLGILAIAGYALLSGGGESTTTGPVTAQEPLAIPVQAAEAKPGAIRSTLTYSGDVDSVHQATLSSRAAGVVTARPVDVGSVVRTGDVLAVLDGAAQRAQLRQAQAGVDAAQARMLQLTTGVKPTDIEAARSALAAAETRYNQLVLPSESSRFEADAGVRAAEAAVENARGSVERTRSVLAAQIWLYCDAYLKFGIDCANITLPLSPAAVKDLEESLSSRFTDPFGFNGQRAQGILEANGGLIAAMAGEQTAKNGLDVAKNRRQTLLNPSTADLAAARAAVDQARAGVETRLKPYSDGDLLGVQAGISQSLAQAELAQTALDDTTVRAPFDGVVAATLVEVGALVGPGAPIASLVASDLEVVLTVDEARLNEVKAGIPAELTVGAYPGRQFKARVDSVAPTGDARTHTFEVKVRAEDPERLLRPGMYAAVTLVTASKDGALLVPAQALTTQLDGRPALLVIKDGKAALRPVRVGLRNTENVEILEGIARGEQVVVVGQTSVRDGQAVVVKVAPAQP